MENYLDKFLKAPANSVSREVLVFHRTAYDLRLASALSGHDLRAYRPEVDRDGFDLLLDQKSIARFLQLKTVLLPARTSSWSVRSHLLHPSRLRAERLGFPLPKLGLGDGLDGAILISVLRVEGDEVCISYRFFDLAVAAMHACGLGLSSPAPQLMDKAENFIQMLRKQDGGGTVKVPACMFVSVPSAEGILELLGMRTRFSGSWAYDALWAYRMHKYPGAKGDGASNDEHRERCRRAFGEVAAGRPSGEVW